SGTSARSACTSIRGRSTPASCSISTISAASAATSDTITIEVPRAPFPVPRAAKVNGARGTGHGALFMSLLQSLQSELEQMSKAGTLKRELPLKSPQGPVVQVEGKGEVIMLTSNNYLGLADHPAIVEAAEKAERDYGYGLASVRFICGTQTIHRELEHRIADFFGTEDTILYGSCWNA